VFAIQTKSVSVNFSSFTGAYGRQDEALEHTDFQSNMAEQNRVPRRRLSFAKPPGVEMSGDVSSQELDPSSSGLVFRKAIDAIATEATIPPNKTPPFEDSIWVQKLVALFKRLARSSSLP
jgi:hypothetical protein